MWGGAGEGEEGGIVKRGVADVHDLGGDFGLPQKRVHFVGLIVHDQGDHGAGRTGAGGAPRPVQVRLVLGRRVDVHDEGDVVDVDAASGDVRGHEDGNRPVLETGDGTLAGALRLVAVQRQRIESYAPELFHLPVHAVLGAHEHDGLARPAGDAHDHVVAPLTRAHADKGVAHRVHGGGSGRGGMRNGVVQEVVDERRNVFVERGGEKQSLPIGLGIA